MTPSTHLLHLEGVHKRFPQSSTDVLSGVDCVIDEGSSVAIIGPSGCGKSTLLNIMGGLLPQSSGSVRFDGTDLQSLSAEALAAFRNREVGFIFQSHHLLPQCTALENVLVPTLAGNALVTRQEAEARARQLLDEVGLGHRLGHRPAAMSGGECQRVAVVRALIHGPRLLLADEPTGSLDEAAADQLADLLCQLNADHKVALVTVTHAPRLAERMRRTVNLRAGRLVQDAEAGR